MLRFGVSGMPPEDRSDEEFLDGLAAAGRPPFDVLVPRLVEASPPSDGPHLMYAIQWFGFAAITLAGAAVFLVGRQAQPPEGDRA
mgnify:CR=1 FL=1